MDENLLVMPSATDTPERHADWLELCALDPTEDGISIREFIRDLKISGTTDAVGRYEEGEDRDLDEVDICEAIAEDAFAELDDRYKACGGDVGGYPFRLGSSVLEPRPDINRSAYLFMALLSLFGKDAGPADLKGAKLFEELSAKAAEGYIGGKAMVFGFPRRIQPKGFADALDTLCRKLGEGRRHLRPETPDQKDAKLDIVVWKDFADRRAGKLIAFGQCATGNNWNEKVTELPQPNKWCQYWMIDPPAIDPMRIFFVPHRIETNKWLKTNMDGGILFDRCRIAQYTVELDSDLSAQCDKWSSYVISEHNLLDRVRSI